MAGPSHRPWTLPQGTAGRPSHDVGGNPAPVWLVADALSANEMQELARSSGHESVFVLKPRDTSHRLRMRNFVPQHEMEMCGHATIAALWLLRHSNAWNGTPTAVQTASGLVHGRWWDGMVEISQPQATVRCVDPALVHEIARCLNIDAQDVATPVINASTCRVKTLIRLASTQALHALQPILEGVEPLCQRLGSTGLYPYARSPDDALTVSARQFPKSSGYPEDAATGIAAAALAWGLREQQLVARAKRWGHPQASSFDFQRVVHRRLSVGCEATRGRCEGAGMRADLRPRPVAPGHGPDPGAACAVRAHRTAPRGRALRPACGPVTAHRGGYRRACPSRAAPPIEVVPERRHRRRASAGIDSAHRPRHGTLTRTTTLPARTLLGTMTCC